MKPEPFRVVGGGLASFSQAHQDVFVRLMLDSKPRGRYLEIGASDPVEANNTYILERDLEWSGVSLDVDEAIVRKFNEERSNPCLIANALTYDFESCLEKIAIGGRVDYLSLDIDPAEVTYRALLRLPLDKYRFSVITYEHDRYLSGPEFMVRSREHLESKGYQLVVSNVMVVGRDFEDWWVDPVVVPEGRWKRFESSHIECAKIFAAGEGPKD